MMERAQTCTFTGHRENKLPWGENENDPRCLRLKERIYDAAEAAYRAGARHGGAVAASAAQTGSVSLQRIVE